MAEGRKDCSSAASPSIERECFRDLAPGAAMDAEAGVRTRSLVWEIALAVLALQKRLLH